MTAKSTTKISKISTPCNSLPYSMSKLMVSHIDEGMHNEEGASAI